MEVRQLPDRRWDVLVTVADVACSHCWAAGGEPCVDENGAVLTARVHSARKGKEGYQLAGPPYYHHARWTRATRRGVTPGWESIRAIRETVRKSAPVKPLYGRSWNPWPEDYGEYKEEWQLCGRRARSARQTGASRSLRGRGRHSAQLHRALRLACGSSRRSVTRTATASRLALLARHRSANQATASRLALQ